jgi:hypothetical protein
MRTKFLKASILVLSVGLMSGCADMTQIEEAKAAANAAMARANDAYNLAQNAHTVASEAAYAADQATKDAQAALACCNENSSRLNRMFEKAMMK